MPKLRHEFCALGSARGRLGGQVDLPAAEPLASAILDLGSSPTLPGSRPVVPSGVGTVFIRLVALEHAAYVALGPSPDPTAEPRILLLPGRPQILHAPPGALVSAMLAPDMGVQAGSGAVGGTDRSGTMSAGGTAQQVCPANAFRRYLLIANPDEARTFWFSSSGPASTGAGSIAVGPGGAFVFDKVVPAGAISVYAASAGQPFTVTEA